MEYIYSRKEGNLNMDEIDFDLIQNLNLTKNITKTADRMNLTQSAISKRISNIEDELNTVLFIRSHSGVHFTPSGEKVLKYCSSISKEISEMKLCLHEASGDVFGSLVVGVSDNYMIYHLPDLVSAFHNDYPNVNLKIITQKGHLLYPMVLSDELDIAISRGDYNWEGQKKLLGVEAMCVVCNKEFEGRNLNSYTYIDRETDAVQYSLMAKWRHENNIKQSEHLIKVDSITSSMDLVKRGLGWALIPEIALANFEGCSTPCFFADGTPFVRLTYLYCKSSVAQLPQAKAFINEAVKRKKIYPYSKNYNFS